MGRQSACNAAPSPQHVGRAAARSCKGLRTASKPGGGSVPSCPYPCGGGGTGHSRNVSVQHMLKRRPYHAVFATSQCKGPAAAPPLPVPSLPPQNPSQPSLCVTRSQHEPFPPMPPGSHAPTRTFRLPVAVLSFFDGIATASYPGLGSLTLPPYRSAAQHPELVNHGNAFARTPEQVLQALSQALLRNTPPGTAGTEGAKFAHSSLHG